MSLPPGVAKADNGMIFFVRTKRELDAMSSEALEERLRVIKAFMTPDGGGLEFISSYVRNIAMAERRGIVAEIVKRIHTR